MTKPAPMEPLSNVNKLISETNRIMPSFALQLRDAADDPLTGEGRLRQGMRDASYILEKQAEVMSAMHSGVLRLYRHFCGLAILFTALLLFNAWRVVGWP